MNWVEIYETAKAWTLEAGEILRRATQEIIEVEYKTSASDLVTQKDKEVEQFFINKLADSYPSHYLLGEEGLANDRQYDPNHEIVWIVDPIDGTTNFVHQKRNFAISVGIYEKGQPRIGFVYDPIANELFHAQVGQGAYLNNNRLQMLPGKTLEEANISINQLWLVPNSYIDHVMFTEIIQKARGTRYIGSAALEIAYVACGRLDTYIDMRLSAWDIAGGMVILREVAGAMKTFHNEDINVFKPGKTFFSNQHVLEEIRLHLNKK